MKLRLIISFIALLAGGLMTADGLWIKGKAVLAQYLLEDAWQRIQQGESRVKPWSWADTWPVAQISLPRLNLKQVVLSGASGRVLAFAPGHILGTAPLEGIGNAVISGHRDTHFSWLKDVKAGDVIDLALPDGRLLKYAVAGYAVHHESETNLLQQGQGDLLRLITCYPFLSLMPDTDQRYVVTTKRIVF